jgi:hypothetical protein
MEAKDALKEISVRQLLLAPMYLLHELYAALIPGVIFLFLFLLKGSHFMASAFSTTAMLGYKTRLVLLTVIAFVIGKVMQSVVVLGCQWLAAIWRWPVTLIKRRQKTLSGTPEKKLTESDQDCRHLLIGVFKGITLAKDGSEFDQHERQRATAGFLMNLGCVLLIAGCYPGDGLRAYELAGGVMCMITGVAQSNELHLVYSYAFGLGLGNFLSQQSGKGKIEPTALLETALSWFDPDFVPGKVATSEEPPTVDTEIHKS